jgi:hypothetical protein
VTRLEAPVSGILARSDVRFFAIAENLRCARSVNGAMLRAHFRFFKNRV